MLEGGLGAGGGRGPGGPPASPRPRQPLRLGRGLCWPRFGEKRASRSGGELERATCGVVCGRCLRALGVGGNVFCSQGQTAGVVSFGFEC